MNSESTITSINVQLDFFTNKPSRTETLFLGRTYTISYLSRKRTYSKKGTVKDIRASYLEDKFIIVLEYSTQAGNIKSIEIFQDDIVDIKHHKSDGGEIIPPRPPMPIKVSTMTEKQYESISNHDPEMIYFLYWIGICCS